jgi:hypothetical protein
LGHSLIRRAYLGIINVYNMNDVLEWAPFCCWMVEDELKVRLLVCVDFNTVKDVFKVPLLVCADFNTVETQEEKEGLLPCC